MKKVLLMLCLGISFSFQPTAFALETKISAKDAKWAAELSNSSTQMLWQHFKEQMAEQEQQEQLDIRFGKENKDLDVTGLESRLYVFVSTSMPHSLLKSYYDEANKYSGILVFKGLPNGSFKELLQLISELMVDNDENKEQLASIQIDDEAYEKFSVSSVPTIVLSKENQYHPLQEDKIEFDKITGNVGIGYSLEEFYQKGDLQIEAKAYLELNNYENK